MSIHSFNDNGVMNIVLEDDCLGHDQLKNKNVLNILHSDSTIKRIVFIEKNLNKWDSLLVVLIFNVIKFAKERSIHVCFDDLSTNLKNLINLAIKTERRFQKKEIEKKDIFSIIGEKALNLSQSFKKGIDFIVIIFLSLGRFIKGKATFRNIDFLFLLGNCTYRSVPIISLVSLMIGIILSFVGSMQLRMFGAQIYVANMVSLSMTRIMGAIMVGIIVAGRTASSFAATLGTMQANEEIDALKTMNIPVIDFLVLPRLLSTLIAMPFLTILADFMGIVGGFIVSILALDLSFPIYLEYSIDSLSLTNFLVGLFHSFLYGTIVAICGCFYGIECGRDANSVGISTTKAVVSSIVWIIFTTGMLTFLFERLGI